MNANQRSKQCNINMKSLKRFSTSVLSVVSTAQGEMNFVTLECFHRETAMSTVNWKNHFLLKLSNKNILPSSYHLQA